MRFQPADFQLADLKNKVLLRSFLSSQDTVFCDYSPINLVIWGRIYDVRWQISGRRLWIYSFGRQRMFFPLGEPVEEGDLLAVSDRMAEQGLRGDFVFVEKEYLDQHPDLGRHFAIVEEAQNADYIHLTERLVQLKGSKLAKKKNLISQFQRLYPDYRVLPLQPTDAAECLELAERWCKIRSCDQVGYLHETSALKKALESFDALELGGVKIRVDHRLVAYSVFSSLNAQMADVHFEKFDPSIKGVGQMINWETARACLPRYKYMNREQDLGIPGLRQAKKSYNPDCLLVPYFLRRL